MEKYWIKCSEKLPEDKQRVLIFYPNGRCVYDGKGDNISVAWFRKGKTFEENTTGRYSFADEFGNNKKPYRWDGDGPMDWLGQEVTHWQPLPEFPIEEDK